jgi:hypothetical protein
MCLPDGQEGDLHFVECGLWNTQVESGDGGNRPDPNRGIWQSQACGEEPVLGNTHGTV